MTGVDARTVLIVEDEPTLLRGLQDVFAHHGFSVLSATDGDRGFELGLSKQADVIVLDVMLPGRDGFDVCRALRQRGVMTPILMLTAKGAEADRVAGLDLGADDYLAKPFSVVELVARVRALLRRSTAGGMAVDGRVTMGAAVVDFRQFVAIRDGQEHALTKIEVALLRLFAGHPREVLSRDRLLNEVWGYDSMPTTRTIDTFVLRLRQKIEPNSGEPVHLLTVHGTGYRYVP